MAVSVKVPVLFVPVVWSNGYSAVLSYMHAPVERVRNPSRANAHEIPEFMADEKKI